MEFRKMVTITLCMRQQKRQWCIEQSFGLVGEGEGGIIWDNSDIYIISYVVDSCWYMAKPIQNCKVISFQLNLYFKRRKMSSICQ